MQSTSNLDVWTEINQIPKDLDQIPFLHYYVSSGNKTYGILPVDGQIAVEPDAMTSSVLQRICCLNRDQRSNVGHQSTNGSRMLELHSIPLIHKSRNDIHSIVDKAHELQASPNYCVNIILYSSQHLGRIGTSSKPIPSYHFPVLPGEACRTNIATVDRWKISSAQNDSLSHP